MKFNVLLIVLFLMHNAVKDIFVNRIVEQDVQIISLIEKLKNNIITELKTVRGARRAMTGYKSTSI